jgi:hypothetical protein
MKRRLAYPSHWRFADLWELVGGRSLDAVESSFDKIYRCDLWVEAESAHLNRPRICLHQ